MNPDTYAQTRERAKLAMLETEFCSGKWGRSLTARMILEELGMDAIDADTFLHQIARSYDIEMLAEWNRIYRPMPLWKRVKPEWRQWVEAVGWLTLAVSALAGICYAVEALV